MISTEIYIEDEKLDLVEDILTEFTYTIDDIADFGQKNTSYSKTINLSGTANNNRIFGFVFNLNSNNITDDGQPNVLSNFNAAKAAQCRIFIDKIQIFKGVLRLMEIVQEGDAIQYQCSVYGDLGGFISSLSNKKLEDLDFSAYNQDWTYTNIQNSWNTIAGSGVLFPLIDYGQVSTGKVNFKFPAFRPALYVREYLEKILTASGYTWDFPMLTSSAMMQRLIIPNNQNQLTTTSTSLCKTNATSGTYTFPTRVPLTAVSLGSFTLSTNQITYGGGSSVLGNFTWQVGGQIQANPTYPNVVRFALYKNATVISYKDINVTTLPLTIAINITVPNITINPSDVFYIGVPSEVTALRITAGRLDANSLVPVSSILNYNDNIKINETLPKGIFQRDFFLSICKMFNLYVYDDAVDSKKLIIKPYIDFYSGTQIDWTNKIDRSKPFSIKPMSELNARYYQFKFKQDNDFYAENYRKKYNEGYGDRLYDTEFDFVKDTATTEVIFAASILYQATGTDKLYPAIYKKSNNF